MHSKLRALKLYTILCTFTHTHTHTHTGFQGGSVVKNPPANAGDTGSISGSGRFLREGNGNSLQYFCQGKSHGQKSLAGHSPWSHKSWTGLRHKSNYIYIYINQILTVTANQNLLYTHTKEKGIQT